MFLVRFWNWPLLRPQNITICWLRAMFALKELDRKMHVLRALIEWVAILSTYALLCHHFDPAEGRGHHPSPVCITSVGGSSHTWPRRRPPASLSLQRVTSDCRPPQPLVSIELSVRFFAGRPCILFPSILPIKNEVLLCLTAWPAYLSLLFSISADRIPFVFNFVRMLTFVLLSWKLLRQRFSNWWF